MILLPLLISLFSLLGVAFGHAVVTRPPPRAVSRDYPITRLRITASILLDRTNVAKIHVDPLTRDFRVRSDQLRVPRVAQGSTLSSPPCPERLSDLSVWLARPGRLDNTAPIEYATPRIDLGYNATACPISFCRGLNFEDNRNNVQTFTAGQTIPFQVSIRVRHNGFANVSVVDTQTRTTIGAPLFTWPLYTDTTLQPSQYPKNETDFSVTLPDLGTRCTATGACAIQWWWIGSNQQTYMSCVDFVTV
ncbi:unnamed protein product [Cyclocybe aegerita]|uniref:Chitin-binding type-4 domain-containing protein n=1 Tax=Cyclocybe aegerita TaxID=1973307 RepID=A0A8S0VRK8_CYCAE|nr:unnamed protein product [Cyclocybe aegerita]